MNLRLHKKAIEATPEQGEQLALFSDKDFPSEFKVGDYVWWNGMALGDDAFKHKGQQWAKIDTMFLDHMPTNKMVYHLLSPINLYVYGEEISYKSPSGKSKEELEESISFELGDMVYWSGNVLGKNILDNPDNVIKQKITQVKINGYKGKTIYYILPYNYWVFADEISKKPF